MSNVKRIARVLTSGVVAGALMFGGVAVATTATAAEGKPGKKGTSVSSVVKDKGKKKPAKPGKPGKPAAAAVAMGVDGFPDLAQDNLAVYKQKGVSLEVVPVDPNNKVVTQDYFVIAKGFTGPVKVRVDGWELSMTEFDFKYHPEHYELGKAAVQEFTIPGDGKHRITVTHPYHLLCVMIHAKAGDQKGKTAGTQFEVNAVYDEVWEQEMVEGADGTENESWHRPTVKPAR